MSLEQKLVVNVGNAFVCTILTALYPCTVAVKLHVCTSADNCNLVLIFRQEELPSSDMIVFKEGDNIGVSKLLTFYRKEPFYIQAEYADPLVVPCANPIIGES